MGYCKHKRKGAPCFTISVYSIAIVYSPTLRSVVSCPCPIRHTQRKKIHILLPLLHQPLYLCIITLHTYTTRVLSLRLLPYCYLVAQFLLSFPPQRTFRISTRPLLNCHPIYKQTVHPTHAPLSLLFLKPTSLPPTPSFSSKPPKFPPMSPSHPRKSKKKALIERLLRSKQQPKYGSRANTGSKTLDEKARVLHRYPALAIRLPDSSDRAQILIFQGTNSLCAEVIDLNTMLFIMHKFQTVLSHTTLRHFFCWIPLFELYLERYFLVEDSLIFKWLENSHEPLRAQLRPSARMVLRGKIQRSLRDIIELEHSFTPNSPPGEKLHVLADACHQFTESIIQFVSLLCDDLPPIINQRFDKLQIDKTRSKIVRHLVSHVDYQDFLTLYTRWMTPADLLEWKTKILFPCDFKFFAYSTWDKQMDAAHYQIAAQFEETLMAENEEHEKLVQQSKADFERARATRKNLEMSAQLQSDDESAQGQMEQYSDTDPDESLQSP